MDFVALRNVTYQTDPGTLRRGHLLRHSGTRLSSRRNTPQTWTQAGLLRHKWSSANLSMSTNLDLRARLPAGNQRAQALLHERDMTDTICCCEHGARSKYGAGAGAGTGCWIPFDLPSARRRIKLHYACEFPVRSLLYHAD